MVDLTKPFNWRAMAPTTYRHYQRDYAYCDAQLRDLGMTVRRVELTGRSDWGKSRYCPGSFEPLTAYSH